MNSLYRCKFSDRLQKEHRCSGLNYECFRLKNARVRNHLGSDSISRRNVKRVPGWLCSCPFSARFSFRVWCTVLWRLDSTRPTADIFSAFLKQSKKKTILRTVVAFTGWPLPQHANMVYPKHRSFTHLNAIIDTRFLESFPDCHTKTHTLL